MKRLPRGLTFALGLLMIAAVWRVDRLVAAQVSMAILYLVPVGFVAWYAGEAWGYAAALLSAAAWLQADIAVDHAFKHWFIPYWNAAVRLGFFVIVAALAGMVARLRRLVDKERELSLLKSDMVSLVSHEFGNFLTTFKLCLTLLEDSDGGAPPPSRARCYATLNRVYLHLNGSVRNFLNLNRLEAGRFVPHLRRTALRTLIHGVVAELGPVIDQKRIRLTLDFPHFPVPARADPDAVAVVVANLLVNAFKYTPDGGAVAVRARVEPDAPPRAWVCVEDTGPGIPAAELARLGSGYYRGAHGRRAARDGFGVGLKVVRELLESQGSSLAIDSEPGRGSRFSFRLPLWSDQDETKLAVAGSEAGAALPRR